MGEFELIRRHFRRDLADAGPAVALGIGDDCALLRPTPGKVLAISTDMLVEGRHFLPDVDPAALGHKALAVNLSDLAAMGARPLGFTLALSLPQADDAWLAGLATGLFALADAHRCPLIGGDTTRGPLNLCLTVLGEVEPMRALRRDAARAGDDLYLSGAVGEARLALGVLQGDAMARAVFDGRPDQDALWPAVRARLERPTPRLALGAALAALDPPGRVAALDLSDGLAGDLGHVLQASGVGAEIDWAALPMPPSLARLPEPQRTAWRLHGGDDYELLFAAPASQREAIAAAAAVTGTPVTRIGRLVSRPGLRLRRPDGATEDVPLRGFDHFG